MGTTDLSEFAAPSGSSITGMQESTIPGKTSFVFTIITIYAPTEGSQDDSKSPTAEDMTASQLSRLKAAILAKLHVQAPNSELLRSQITLRKIRTQIVNTWPGATPFRFCNEFGDAFADSQSLGAYFDGLKRPPKAQDTALNIFITAANSEDPNQLIISLLKQPFLLKFMRLLDSKNTNNEGSLDSSAFKNKSAANSSLAILRGFIETMSADAGQDVFCLPDGTPIPDAMSLEQYLGIAKPSVSSKDKVPTIPIFIKKAALSIPQPISKLSGRSSERQTLGISEAYQSKKGRSQGSNQSVIDKLGNPDHELTDRSGQELHRDKSHLKAKETLHESDYTSDPDMTVAHANKLNEYEWDLILRNSNAFRGWIVDFKGNKIARAPYPAFKLREGLNLVKVADNLSKGHVANPPPPYSEPSSSHEHLNEQVDPATGVKLPPLESKDVQEFIPWKPQAVPSFSINDDSDIDVASVQHEFGYSMAQNHFDKTVFEVEGSDVIEGITVGANAAMSNEQSSGSAASNKQVTKTLIATYKIPRATVYLPPEDLEPTEEFVTAINRVRETRNIIDLRKLHKAFGQIFCAEIVVGGCLQTSKILTAGEREEEKVQRNKFKGSVGVAVGVPQVASVATKLSHEAQDHSESGTREFDQRESLSFRATGGNTILSANPPAWLSSVASDSNSWRIIQQADLRPVMDMVSEIPGYEQVRMWFLQATPKLTEYIVIPQQRSFDARFKVDFSHDGISRALTGSEGKDKQAAASKTKMANPPNVQAYLAHDPKHPPAHFLTSVKTSEKTDVKESPLYFKNYRPYTDMTTTIYQTSETTTKKIFEPAQTQAPVLFCPQTLPDNDPDIPGLLADGRTVWRIEVPFGYSLTHNSLVTLKSQAEGQKGLGLTLTVYRNAQGVFMPAITSHTDPLYWRILKKNRSGTSSLDQIRFGDQIRLCWRFSDQSSGWRDYLDDFYGRRRFDSPAELRSDEGTLFLKTPFPRFEGLTARQGASMLLSTVSDTEPVLQVLKVLDLSYPQGTRNVTYNLFDLSFRLDFVGNNGSGEALDYMNVAFTEMRQMEETKLISKKHETKDQSVFDVTKRMGTHILKTHFDQLQNLANAVSKGSAVDVMRETFKTGFMNHPLGRLATIFGYE